MNSYKSGIFSISMDVEDWSQSTWDHSLEINERAAVNVENVLDILKLHERTITMFVLGKFAERFPAVVKRISEEGHEIASHGYGHVEVFQQSRKEFRTDVDRSKKILEDITGKPVIGYRAPDYSITKEVLWAFDILANLGFVYDSSIYPTNLSRYGIPDWPPDPVRVILPSGSEIVEFPLTTVSMFGVRWPVAGGGYHRLLPGWIIKYLIKTQLRHNKVFLTYCHPYEFDPDELNELDFRVPLSVRLHQGLGRRGYPAKFESLLKTFETVHISSLGYGSELFAHRIHSF